MPVGAVRVIPAQEQPADVWIIGSRLVSGSWARPVVFHKSANSSAFVVKYDGSEIPTGESLSFLRGVRNRKDAPGVISVHSFYQYSTGLQQQPAWQAKTFARSEDNGATWTYPGITSATRDVQSEEFTALEGSPTLYTSNDVQMVGGVCSPEPGVVFALGKERTGTKDTTGPVLRRYYEYDLCLLQSIDGGPMERTASVAPWTRYNTAYDPIIDGPPFYDTDISFTNASLSNTPRAMPSSQAPARFVSVEIRAARGQVGGYTREYSYATIGADGSAATFPIPYGTPPAYSPSPPDPWGTPPVVVWDGQHFYYGDFNADGVQAMVRAESADGPWESVYTGGTTAYGGGAARRAGKLYVSGKGVTTDGGQNWTTVSRTLTRVGFFGSRYYGFSGTTVYTSRDGMTWTAVSLPAVSGLFSLVDVFGG